MYDCCRSTFGLTVTLTVDLFRFRLIELVARRLVLFGRDLAVQMQCKLAVTVHRFLRHWYPWYLTDYCVPVSEVPGRQHPWSARCHQLWFLWVRRGTSGTRAFSVARPTVWHSLPDHLRDPAVDSKQFRLEDLSFRQPFSLPSTRQHPSYGECLEVKREYYQNCSVLGCVTQCLQSAAHSYEQFLQVQ